jgi:hypothetical protein
MLRFRDILVVLVLTALMGACDNTISPIVPGSNVDVVIYGYLDTAADTQFVRVERLRPTAQDTGVTTEIPEVLTRTPGSDDFEWTHRSQSLEDGTEVNLFFAAMSPLPGRNYDLRVTTSRGVTSAKVTIPDIPVVRPAVPSGDSVSLRQEVTLDGVVQPLRLAMLYKLLVPESPDTAEVKIDYGRGGRAQGDNWVFDVFLKRDQTTSLVRIGRSASDSDVALQSIGLQADLLSPEWAAPEASANISSGLGFFGAIGRFRVNWTLEQRFVGLMGFRNAQ